MASCTNCGSDLAEGVQFCTTCGTPAAAAPTSPVPPTPPGPAAGAPAATEPVAPVGPPAGPDATAPLNDPGADPTQQVPPTGWGPPGAAAAPTEAVPPAAPLWNPGGTPEAAPGYAAGGEPPLWDPAGTGGASSSSSSKVVLIALGAVVALFVLGIGAVAFALTRGGDDDGEVATETTEQQTTTTEADADTTSTTEAVEDTTTTEQTDSPGGGQVPTAEVGTCVTNDLVGGGNISSFDEVPCSEPHRGEMFLKFDLAEGAFPGAEAINAQVTARCQGPEFDAYVGQTYASSEAYISPVTPTEQTWNEADDREVLCFLVRQDGGERTGSYRGSGL